MPAELGGRGEAVGAPGATKSGCAAQVVSPVGIDAVEGLVEPIHAHAGSVEVIGARPARLLDLAGMGARALPELVEQFDCAPVARHQLTAPATRLSPSPPGAVPGRCHSSCEVEGR
jgi:hypothetical protein